MVSTTVTPSMDTPSSHATLQVSRQSTIKITHEYDAISPVDLDQKRFEQGVDVVLIRVCASSPWDVYSDYVDVAGKTRKSTIRNSRTFATSVHDIF